MGGQIHARKKAFNSIQRMDIWNILKRKGVEQYLIKSIKSLYKNDDIRVRNETLKTFTSKIGLKQGCIISPLIMNLMMDDIVKKCKESMISIE